MEAAPITLRVHAKRAAKRDAHRLGGAEPACGGDLRDTARRFLEQTARRLHAHALHEPSGRHPDLAHEHAEEVAWAHGDSPGERLDREIDTGVPENPRLQVAQGLALGELGRELGAELRLTAGPLEKED